MEYYNSIDDLDIAIWTVDYLTAIDEFETGKISKEDKELLQGRILQSCTAKYGSYDKLLTAIFGEL